MISSIRGTAQHVGTDLVVVDLHGMGVAVAVPMQCAAAIRLGAEVFLHTSLIVREDALSLYGFETRAELDVFGLLLSVSGVGPKSALGVLSRLTVDEIAAAVSADDDGPFRKVSGIGPKTAKLIVVQLAGKLAAPTAGVVQSVPSSGDAVLAQVVQALMGLGWPERVAGDAAAAAVDRTAAGEKDSVQTVLRTALSALGPARPGGERG